MIGDNIMGGTKANSARVGGKERRGDAFEFAGRPLTMSVDDDFSPTIRFPQFPTPH